MSHSTLTSKGQTTVPLAVREALDLRPGDRIRYEVSDGRVVLKREPRVDEVAGILRGKIKRPVAAPRQEKAAARRAWATETSDSGISGKFRGDGPQRPRLGILGIDHTSELEDGDATQPRQPTPPAKAKRGATGAR